MTLSKKISEIQKTGIAVLRDDSSSPGRAVLVLACQGLQAELLNRALHLGKGHVFAAISRKKADAFRLLPMDRRSQHGRLSAAANIQHACVSVEARTGVSTGISAPDRARTLAVLGSNSPHPKDLVMPGHIFPVVVKDGGVLVKHTLLEGSHDLVQICFESDGAVMLDLLDEQGELMRDREVEELARREELALIELSQIVEHRLEHEQLVRRVAEAKLPSRFATDLRSIVYKSSLHDGEHLALVKGDIRPDIPILTRVQSEHTISDVFGGERGSRRTLQNALQVIGEQECGVLVYLRNSESGELSREIEEGFTKDENHRNTNAIMREYGLGAQILRDLGVRKIKLLTGSKKNLVGLSPFGIEIVSQQSIPEKKLGTNQLSAL